MAAAVLGLAVTSPAAARQAEETPVDATPNGAEAERPPGRVLRVRGPAGELRVLDTGPPSGGSIPAGPAAAREEAARSGTGDARSERGPLPVIFVHSLAGSLEQWTPQLRHLAGRRRAVALDLRGHGGSDVPTHPDYTVLALAEDVVAAADSLGLDRFVLVGHSLGGAVAAAVAARHPRRVSGLLFADAVGDQRQARGEVVQFLFELDRDYRGTISSYWDSILEGASEATRRRVLEDLEQTGPEAVVKALEGLLYFDPTALLAGWNGPMLAVITPLNDNPISLQNVVPDLEAVTVEGTSHWLQLDAPEDFNRILDRFLRRADPAVREG